MLQYTIVLASALGANWAKAGPGASGRDFEAGYGSRQVVPKIGGGRRGGGVVRV